MKHCFTPTQSCSLIKHTSLRKESCLSLADASEGQNTIHNFSFGMMGGKEEGGGGRRRTLPPQGKLAYERGRDACCLP